MKKLFSKKTLLAVVALLLVALTVVGCSSGAAASKSEDKAMTDAIHAAEAAKSDAESALTKAESAQAAAESAQSKSEAAQSKAEEAQAKAAKAQSDAESAASAAEDAAKKADEAAAHATAAKNSAEAAEAAKLAAEAAKTAAETAKTAAEAAKTAVTEASAAIAEAVSAIELATITANVAASAAEAYQKAAQLAYSTALAAQKAAEASAANGGGGSAITAATESLLPGNFSIYDYFADVYGFNSSVAYKYYNNLTGTGNQSNFRFGTKTYYTVNERSVTYTYYTPFQTLAYEPATFLLETDLADDLGYYAIVFGGEWESKTKDTLLAVNNAAAKFAVDKTRNPSTGAVTLPGTAGSAVVRAIYNFDFKINGGLEIESNLIANGIAPNALGEYDSDIRTDVSQNGAYGSSTSRYTLTNMYLTLWNALDTTTYATELDAKGFFGDQVVVKRGDSTNALTTNVANTAKIIDSPSIILIKKQIVDGKLKNTVVDYIDAAGVDFANETQKNAFTDGVYNLLSAVPTTSAEATTAGLPSTATGLKKFDYFTYIFGTYTQGSGTGLAYAREGAVPSNSFTSSVTGDKLNVQYNNLTDKNHVYKFTTYAELVHLLKSEGYYAFYFGGSWCHYSRGFLAPFNAFAQNYKINQVYFFDPYINGSSSTFNIRNSETQLTGAGAPTGASSQFLPRLYANLFSYFGIDWNTGGFPSSHDYLSNKIGVADEDLSFPSVEGGYAAPKKIGKIGVPTLIAYNKDNVDVFGRKATVLGKASSGDTFEAIVARAYDQVLGGKYWGTLKNDPSDGNKIKFYNELTSTYTEIGAYSASFAATINASITIPTALNGVKFYSNVDYVRVVNSDLAGRKAEYGIITLLEDFYNGHLTYAVKR